MPFQGSKNLNLRKRWGQNTVGAESVVNVLQKSVSVTAQGAIFCEHMSVLDILGLKTCVMKKREYVILVQTQIK